MIQQVLADRAWLDRMEADDLGSTQHLYRKCR